MRRLSGPGPARVTVVIAPAGWGKTTLLGQWARDPHERRRIAWVSLDAADDEPVRFWSYVLNALGAVAPEIVEEPLRALRMAALDPVEVVLPMLLNALAATEERLALVLDDYHLLADGPVHEQVEFLLAYRPPALHLVIAGRADPPLPLARLRPGASCASCAPTTCASPRTRRPVWSARPGWRICPPGRCSGSSTGPRAGRPGCGSRRSASGARPTRPSAPWPCAATTGTCWTTSSTRSSPV